MMRSENEKKNTSVLGYHALLSAVGGTVSGGHDFSVRAASVRCRRTQYR